MASLAFTVAGLAIGSALGGPLGASIGSAIGSAIGNWLLAPDQKGPKLGDLRLQNASYGAPIPVGWGTKRLAGNIIWQTDLVPHEKKSHGKGGPSITETSYTASFQVQIADCTYLDGTGALINEPIVGIRRIWANGRVIYGAGSSGELPMTVYYGTEEQDPDPTIEAEEGVGNVPAYLGKAYVVFADMDMGQFGNALPSLEFEVQFTGNVFLEYYAEWPVDYDYGVNSTSYSYPDLLNGVDSSVAGQITMHRYRSGNDYGPEMGVSDDYLVYYESKTFDYHGNELSSTAEVTTDFSRGDTGVNAFVQGSLNSGHAYVAWHFTFACPDKSPPATELTTFAWMKDGAVTYTPDILLLCAVATPSTVGISTTWSGDLSLGAIYSLVYWNGNLYATGADDVNALWIRRWPAPDGSCYTRDHDAEFDLTPYTGDNGFGLSGVSALILGNDGYLYCQVSYNGGAFPDPEVLGGWGNKLVKLDGDLNLIYAWYSDTTDGKIGGPIGSAVVWNGYWIKYYSAGVFNIGNPNYILYRMGPDDFTWVDEILAIGVCNSDSPPICNPVSPLVLIQGTNLAALRAGILTLGNDYITLGEIVASVSSRVGYAESEYDTGQLTDIVRGYVAADRTTGRALIDTLRPIYQFSAVESNQLVKFRKWTGEVDVTIDENDLGTRPFGDDKVDPENVTRALESELPQQVDAVFCNVDMDYQEGHQLRQREVTESELKVSVSMPVAMTPGECLQRTDTIMLTAWVERDKFSNQLSRKYLYVEPTDVISIRGRPRRIVNKQEQGYTHVVLESVAALTSVFVTAPAPAPAIGFVPQPVPVPNNTDTRIMDLPLIEDTDSQVGFYVAMAGRKAGTWPSGTLFKSIDGGVNYTDIDTTSTPIGMGVALEALGDFEGGSDIVDESNTLEVRMSPGSPTLESTTETGLFNGVNRAALWNRTTEEWEIVGYRDVVLVSARVYRLSGWLRGQRGTEQHIAGHIPEDMFTLLPALNEIGSSAELGQERHYKGVTAGKALSSESAIAFTNNGNALKPYAPVQLGGGRDGSGNLTVHWTPRTRIGGAWVNNTDVPFVEAFERYSVIFYDDDTYTTSVRQQFVDDATEYEYLAADQTTDLGSPQNPIHFEVGQIGSYGEGYYTRGVA